jgi:hypothetical protein
MAKPGDFFVGVTDLFSVLMPGAVVSFIAVQAEQSLHPPADLFGLLRLKDASGYTAFLVCSFLLGHLVDMVGASVLDRVYDLLYADFKRSGAGFRVGIKQTPKRLADAVRAWYKWHLLDPPIPQPEDEAEKPQDPVYVEARLRAAPKPKGDKLYQWCRDWLQMRSPQTLQEPDRLQANSKFFRGLVVVASIFTVLFWVLPGLRNSYSVSAAQNCLWTASGLLVVALSFFRYSNLRWKAVQHVYRLYVIARYTEENGLSGAPQPAGIQFPTEEESGQSAD